MCQAISSIAIYTGQKPAKTGHRECFSVDCAGGYSSKLDITFYDSNSDNRIESEKPDRGVVTEWPPPPLPVPREN